MSWRPDLPVLEAALGTALGARVRLAVAHAGAAADAVDAPRAVDRRNGRAALATLLRAAGRDDEAATLHMPHREFSLSHSAGWAVAAGVADCAGVGVDVEFARPVDPRTARWFLTDREQGFVAPLEGKARDAALLRLWTAKEALFKASPDNAALLLADFELADPAAAAGTARGRDRAHPALRYCSLKVDGAWLSLAVTPATESPP
jgi:4'-phosphopantetheinyl transferase EntD